MKTPLPVILFVLKTMRHKVHVFRFGLETGAPVWRLLIHDWRKLTPPEIFAYSRRFCGDGGGETAFAYAWLHHSKNSPHHWQYWIPVTAHSFGTGADGEPLPMPEWAVREMVADWLGAAASEGHRPASLSDWGWYRDQGHKVRLHPTSRIVLDRVLADYFGRRSRIVNKGNGK